MSEAAKKLRTSEANDYSATHPVTSRKKARLCVTTVKDPQVAYSFWRNLKNLPLFMKDLENIEVMGPKTSRWMVKLKSGLSASWTAEITEEVFPRRIAWRSVENSEVKTVGSITFTAAPQGRGTVIELTMDYQIPGGKLGEFIVKFTGEDPDTLTLTNLRRFKAMLETDEVPTIEGQPNGRE